MRLKDKVAIVTGATRGVGRGIAIRFAEQGAKVIIAGRTVEAGQEVEATIRSNGGIARFVRADLGIEADCKNLVDVAERELGPLTTLVNNAAATTLLDPTQALGDANMHLVTNEALDTMWRSDLYGLFWCCRYALRAMLEHGNGGSIINISSGAGMRGSPHMTAYAASKAAMNGATRAMAATYARQRIRCNAIVLGLINNGGQVARMLENEAAAAAVGAMIPLPFVGEPDDIAWGAIYLASDESRYVTGVELPIDGGAINIVSTDRVNN